MSRHSNNPFDGLDLEVRLVKKKKTKNQKPKKPQDKQNNKNPPQQQNKKTTADRKNCYVDSNALSSQEQDEEFFFFSDAKHVSARKLLSLEIHQMEALFEGISKSINVAQTGSGVTLYRLSSRS